MLKLFSFSETSCSLKIGKLCGTLSFLVKILNLGDEEADTSKAPAD